MLKRNNSTGNRTQPESKPSKWEAAMQQTGRILLLVIALLQLLSIVQSVSPTDAVLHGAFLIAIILYASRRTKSPKALR